MSEKIVCKTCKFTTIEDCPNKLKYKTYGKLKETYFGHLVHCPDYIFRYTLQRDIKGRFIKQTKNKIMNEQELKAWGLTELERQKIIFNTKECDNYDEVIDQVFFNEGQKKLITHLKNIMMYVRSYANGLEDDGLTPCHYYSFDIRQEEWDAILNNLGIKQ